MGTDNNYKIRKWGICHSNLIYLVIHKAQIEAAALNKKLLVLVAAGFIPAFKTLNRLNWRG